MSSSSSRSKVKSRSHSSERKANVQDLLQKICAKMDYHSDIFTETDCAFYFWYDMWVGMRIEAEFDEDWEELFKVCTKFLKKACQKFIKFEKSPEGKWFDKQLDIIVCNGDGNIYIQHEDNLSIDRAREVWQKVKALDLEPLERSMGRLNEEVSKQVDKWPAFKRSKFTEMWAQAGESVPPESTVAFDDRKAHYVLKSLESIE